MRYFKRSHFCFFVCLFVASLWPLVSFAQIPHPKTYIPTLTEIEKHKKFFDDPAPYLKTFGPKQVLPKELYSKLIYDEEIMKRQWAALVGFKAPDVVGKIAPEIKPGKYTYKDKDKYPGFKQLMWPHLYNRFKPGEPPHGGNIPEFEIIPTRQYYWALPIGEATERNLGKTKLNKEGYLIPETWVAGYPFPSPSGEFKAQQIMYNVEKRYLSWEGNFYLKGRSYGYTKDLKLDFDGGIEVRHIKLAGRTLMEPYGWFDKRAKDQGEFRAFILSFDAPRDIAGATQSAAYYQDPNKPDQLMMYIPSLRRVRKLTGTDTQDPIMGLDLIYDDNEGWMQKLSPIRYPYKFEVIEEREYLVPASSLDGSEYISSKGLEFRNIKMERRPLYVLQLTQLDPNYVYSKRIFYIDKETFNYYHVENYDRKGRLYRVSDTVYSFFPEMGITSWAGALAPFWDHVDLHSTIQHHYQIPAFWTRPDISIEGTMKQK